MSAPERKYVLTRVKAGDYLLPSNDGKTIWRIERYEDGPSHGLEVDWSSDRKFWRTWRWTGTVAEAMVLDVEDWDRWELFDQCFDTRAQAILAALKADRQWRDDMRAQVALRDARNVLWDASRSATSAGNVERLRKLAVACQADYERLVAVWD